MSRLLSALALLGFMVAACADTPSEPGNPQAPSFDFIPGGVIVSPVIPNIGEAFIICKTGPDATFRIRENGVEVGTVAVADGECRRVYQKGGATVTVTSEEIVPPGVQLDEVRVTQVTCGLSIGNLCDPNAGPVVTGPTIVSDPASGLVGGTGPSGNRTDVGLAGVLVEYFNSLIPGGGEGCTPGYWKQEQHFDSYPAPYLPTTTVGSLGSADLNAAYGSGTTFLALLNDNGNSTGLEALGRHLIAAILNAANPDVSYDLTVAQIIAGFEAVYPGSKTAYNAFKDELGSFNEQGCPLD